eukprot:NODE_3083_length_820_cov_41.320363_g2562_i0.p4 GENE.NODE_3083_length_820_cov_41.320363_g2562_i0~~NODE_3083_length_820_cov_41.320363_g2562_i0.p4  ORF type:complete len:86 (-),score=9.53 NODE_3083_length_820_cov_41.320363_g2562_i0:301-558(-)
MGTSLVLICLALYISWFSKASSKDAIIRTRYSLYVSLLCLLLLALQIKALRPISKMLKQWPTLFNNKQGQSETEPLSPGHAAGHA